jgi:nitroreductase
MENTILKAMEYRYAVKEFDSSKKISKDIFDQILEAGRLSPSSFGLEHWKFIVVETPKLKEEIQVAAYNQKQVTSSSHMVIILNRISDIATQSLYAKELFKSRMPEEPAKFVTNFHSQFSSGFNESQLSDWSKKQCYIAAGNMMTVGAYLKIDSCPMEGFDESKVQKILDINPKEYGVAMLLPFGYRNSEPRPKVRHPLKDIVEYR